MSSVYYKELGHQALTDFCHQDQMAQNGEDDGSNDYDYRYKIEKLCEKINRLFHHYQSPMILDFCITLHRKPAIVTLFVSESVRNLGPSPDTCDFVTITFSMFSIVTSSSSLSQSRCILIV